MTLPNLQITYSCGSCGGELEHDGPIHACYSCGIHYLGNPADEPEASFAENVNPCGSPGHAPVTERRPFRIVHSVVKEWRTTTTTYEPCSLPSDHTTMFHYHHRTTEHVYDTGTNPTHV